LLANTEATKKESKATFEWDFKLRWEPVLKLNIIKKLRT